MDQKHSRLGIASFISSIVAGISIFILIAIACVIHVTTPGGLDEKSISAVLIGLFLFAFMFVALVAIGLAIGGLFQKNRKKLFAIIGILLSTSVLIGTIFIIILGLAQRSS